MTSTEKLVERGVDVLRRLSVAKVSLSDAYFVAGWVTDARIALREQDARIAKLEADAESLQLAREIISDMARWGHLSADPDERGYFIGDDVLETIMRRAASARGRE